MIIDQCGLGAKIWFRDGAFLREGTVAVCLGPQVCIRAGMQLVLRVRKDVWSNAADAHRAQAEQLAEQIAILQVSHGNAMAQLSKLAHVGRSYGTITDGAGNVEPLTCCECPGCAAKVCQS